MGSDTIQVRPVNAGDKDWIASITREYWGGDIVVVHDTIYRPDQLPGLIALYDEENVGLLTYNIEDDQCEIITLNSLKPSLGVGSALIEAFVGVARQAGNRRLWVITTNDNLQALRFYQKRGFVLVAVHREAVDRSRRYKPIPRIGNDGIPIRDEVELEMILV